MRESYKMRMYRRQMWQRRYVIGGVMWGIIGYLVVMIVIFT